MTAPTLDRRLTPATDRVAHISLQGVLDRPAFTPGRAMEIAAPLADLLTAPEGRRDRQLLAGDGFCVIDETGMHSFGFALKDGFCGWVASQDLTNATPKTHFIASSGTHLYSAPKVQAPVIMPLFLGARVNVHQVEGAWARLDAGYVPLSHLRPIGEWLADPVAIAEGFLGTPYLWGGNSRAGIDCSGLAQLAHLACGIPFPADSDLQASIGTEITDDLRRGDLIFWRGHVAIVVDADRLIHANGHRMAVNYEPIAATIDRVTASGGGQVTARRRIVPVA